MGLVDLLLPDRCVACGSEGVACCERCLGTMTLLRPPLCERCGAPTAWPVARCRECAGRRVPFAQARAAVAYDGPVVPFIRSWKERARRGLAAVAAEIVVRELVPPDGDGVAYVPSVADRERWRGHNTAEQLARELAARWRLPVCRALARRGSPARQRGLSLAARRANVAGGFVARCVPPPRVLLVDDVYTTGATVSAAAAALRAAGADRVAVITFARTLRGGLR